MPAEPERTVLAEIPDVDDRVIRVSLVTWPGYPQFASQAEVADYIPSQRIYGRGFMFDPKHAGKVIAGLRAVKAAG